MHFFDDVFFGQQLLAGAQTNRPIVVASKRWRASGMVRNRRAFPAGNTLTHHRFG